MLNKYAFFVSANPEKLRDVKDVVGSWKHIRIEYYAHSIQEIQTTDLIKVLEHKVIRAFEEVRQPVIVDHTCLGLSMLRGFPGTQSSSFWHYLGTHVCELVAMTGDDAAEVTVGLAYTNGEAITNIVTKVKGTITTKPRGPREFDWDRIFIPAGESRTYAEMTLAEKNARSPRAQAFEQLARRLRKDGVWK